jgi:hypothetical protein
MPSTHHEVPTHLNVEDKLMLGLTVRQFLYLLVGSSASYALWGQTHAAGDLARGALVAGCAAITLAFALLRPSGRPLEEWLAAALVFAAVPRRAVWQLAEPRAADWRPAAGVWHDLAPNLVWATPDETAAQAAAEEAEARA